MMTEETPTPEHPRHPEPHQGIDAEAAAMAKALAEAEAAQTESVVLEEQVVEITETSDASTGEVSEIEITASTSEMVIDGSLLYDSQTTAEMAGIPTELLALYVKLGFVETAEDGEDESGADARFDDEALYVLRRIADLRFEHGVNLKGIGLVLNLLRQVQRLEAELRFLRAQ
ncbi:MAG: chaperone modulator CbpM [Candidatus Methylacidiphilales bacterium]|nr:chaperone modulator CbpM [Candidatus Methylacidiphilales bacterium]